MKLNNPVWTYLPGNWNADYHSKGVGFYFKDYLPS